jgi:hypothetical protein
MLLHGNGTNGAQNNTFLDASTNNLTITRNGNTTQGSFSPYGSNWSNFFDGTGDYLTVPDNSAWAFGSGNFTLEAWVYRTVNGATQMIVIQSDNASAAGSAWSFYILSTNKLRAYVYYGSSFIELTSSSDVPANTWTHVALVRTSGTISQYINGSRDGTSSSLSTNSLNDVAQTVGIAATNAGNDRFTGYLSNLRIIKGAGPYDATASTITIPTAPLTAISGTSLLTCADNRFIDDSTNNFAITKNGDVSVQRFNPFGTATAYSASVIGGSGYFDGNGDYLTTSNATAFSLGSGDFTFEAWVNFSANTDANGDILLSIGDGTSNRPLGIYRDATRVFVDLSTGGANITVITFNATFAAGAWHHLAVVRNSNTIYCYVNGASIGTPTAYSSTLASYTSDVYVGRVPWNGAADMVGYISNLRLVKGAAVYTSNFTPPTAPLTAITNTSLLLNFTNAAIFDNAMMNDMETAGNAQISTSVKKFGTGSIAFDGTGDYLISNTATTDLYAFGRGDFTIEFWAYLNTVSGFQIIYEGRQTGTSTALVPVIYLNGASLRYYVNGGDVITGSNLSTSTWYHIAICRSGTNTKMFINGTQSGSTYTDSTVYVNYAQRPLIGIDANTSGNFYNGYIDDLRITKGYARYISNFTPPTAAFSDTGPI